MRGADTFGYDALGRLTSSVVAGTARGYAYDGDGLLRSRTQGASTTSFLYDASVVPAPLLVAGTERLVYGLGPLYRVHSSSTYDTFVRDGLGSVRLEVSGTGAITNAFDYLAYGKLNVSTAQPLLGYAGELTDPSGLIYLRSRWYDPSTARFLRADDYSGAQVAPSSLNRYAYAEANPTNSVDPSGQCVDPGGSGIRYCVDRFIPTRFACPFPYPCGIGDNRDASANSGEDSYRVRQLIRADGSVQSTAGISGLGYFGWWPSRGTLENCTEQANPGNANVSCTAYNGYPHLAGTPGPIRTQVQIYESGGRVIVTAFGTFYPSLEVWRYGAGGPQLVYFYNARAVDIWSLGHVGHLPNSIGK